MLTAGRNTSLYELGGNSGVGCNDSEMVVGSTESRLSWCLLTAVRYKSFFQECVRCVNRHVLEIKWRTSLYKSWRKLPVRSCHFCESRRRRLMVCCVIIPDGNHLVDYKCLQKEQKLCITYILLTFFLHHLLLLMLFVVRSSHCKIWKCKIICPIAYCL